MKVRHIVFGIASFIVFTILFLMTEFSSAQPAPRVWIENVTAAPGSTVTLSVHFQDYPLQMGGYDFMVAYDKAAMTITSITPGEFYSGCDWELFNTQNRDSAACEPDCSGRMRFVALAETANGPYHPSCHGPADSAVRELAVIHLQISDTVTPGRVLPVRFFWRECADNGIATTRGDFFFIDARIYDNSGALLWDEADDVNFPEAARPLFAGTPDSCEQTEKAQFVCGDANGDGSIDAGDAVAIVDYVFRDGLAPNPVEMGDVNHDGTCNIGDSIYLIGFIFKGGPAPVCDGILRFIDFQHGGVTVQ